MKKSIISNLDPDERIEVEKLKNSYPTRNHRRIELFGLEKDFKIFKHSFDIVAHVGSRHYKSQPFPLTWRVFIKHLK